MPDYKRAGLTCALVGLFSGSSSYTLVRTWALCGTMMVACETSMQFVLVLHALCAVLGFVLLQTSFGAGGYLSTCQLR